MVDDASLTLRVAVELADVVLRLAFRTGPPGDPGLVREAEWVLRSYLEDRLDRAARRTP
jgi:hypothetical protein